MTPRCLQLILTSVMTTSMLLTDVRPPTTLSLDGKDMNITEMGHPPTDWPQMVSRTFSQSTKALQLNTRKIPPFTDGSNLVTREINAPTIPTRVATKGLIDKTDDNRLVSARTTVPTAESQVSTTEDSTSADVKQQLFKRKTTVTKAVSQLEPKTVTVPSDVMQLITEKVTSAIDEPQVFTRIIPRSTHVSQQLAQNVTKPNYSPQVFRISSSSSSTNMLEQPAQEGTRSTDPLQQFIRATPPSTNLTQLLTTEDAVQVDASQPTTAKLSTFPLVSQFATMRLTISDQRFAGPLLATDPPSLNDETQAVASNGDSSRVTGMTVLSIFSQFDSQNLTMVDQIWLIEKEMCGNPCSTDMNDITASERSKCPVCKCDALCKEYRDCCAYKTLKEEVTYDTVTGEDLTACLPLYPIPIPGYTKLKADDQQVVFDKCPNKTALKVDVTNSTYSIADQDRESDAYKCENPDISIPNQWLFASSLTSGFTYRNLHCAACHNDTEQLKSWGTYIVCLETSFKFLSFGTSKEELYNLLISPEGVQKTGCGLQYVPPYPFDSIRTCRAQESNIISACNVSGKISELDPRLEEACGLYTSIFNNKYNNIFCFLCNDEGYWDMERLLEYVRMSHPSHSARVSFSALVDFDGEDVSRSFSDDNAGSVRSAADCLPNEYFDSLMCDCRLPLCGEGKYLTSNGSCVSLVSSDKLGYRVCSQLHIQTKSPITVADILNFREELFFFKYVRALMTVAIFITDWCPGSNTLTVALDEFLLYPGNLEDLEPYVNLTLESGILSVHEFWESSADVMLSVTSSCFSKSQGLNVCDTDPSVQFSAQEITYSHGDKYDIYIQYLQTHLCPAVTLTKGHFTVSTKHEDQLVFEATKKLIPRSQVDEISESEVRLCVSDYLSLTDTDVQVCKRTNTDFDTWTISGLISIVCTCISLLCLFLTFITYTIFPSLRIGGGKNIMVLIVTLFTAQSFYEFAIEQFENRMACKAFGLIIHYTWMAAIFSMNACTIERFYKLCFPLQARAIFLSNKAFLWATAYTFLCPFVIVGINVLVNILVRGEDIGYGSPRLCYINTISSRIWAFAFPMGLVVVVNICLMVITVCKLRQMSGPDRKSSSHNKLGLVACARLSVVTGLTWLMTFLYEAIPWVGFNYTITAHMGLQGLLFFVSMVLNKRVLGLYSDKISRSLKARDSTAETRDRI